MASMNESKHDLQKGQINQMMKKKLFTWLISEDGAYLWVDTFVRYKQMPMSTDCLAVKLFSDAFCHEIFLIRHNFVFYRCALRP